MTDICARLPQMESLTLGCWIPLDCDALGVSSMDELLSVNAEHDSYVDGIYALPGQCTKCIDAFKSCILNAELRAVDHMAMDCPNLQTIRLLSLFGTAGELLSSYHKQNGNWTRD